MTKPNQTQTEETTMSEELTNAQAALTAAVTEIGEADKARNAIDKNQNASNAEREAAALRATRAREAFRNAQAEVTRIKKALAPAPKDSGDEADTEDSGASTEEEE